MPRLVFLEGAHRGAVYDLGEKPVTLGRDATCDLCILDRGVSRAHARIRPAEAGFVLEDLGSHNGTFVNAIPCETRPLRTGDEVRVGETVLLFLAEDPPLPLPGIDGSTCGIAPRRLRPEAAFGPVRSAAIVAVSPEMRELLRFVAKVAPTEAIVLITGESGTGKELIAEAIHENSPRRGHPLVAVNCAAISGTLFESEFFGHERGAFTDAVARRIGRLELAGNGTVFLDEIGELPLDSQAKLLRVLSTGDFQRVGGAETLRNRARVIAATNRDLKEEVRKGRFREDLYYRIQVVNLALPPLRGRPADIRPIVEHYFGLFRDKMATPLRSVSPEAMAALERYPWPGNVRELRNVIERAVMLAEQDVLLPADLPPEIRGGAAPPEAVEIVTMAELEKRHILRALEVAGWHRGKTAALLGIDRKTLYTRILEYGLGDRGEPEETPGGPG